MKLEQIPFPGERVIPRGGVLGEGVKLMKGFFATLGEEKAKLIVGGDAARVWGIRDDPRTPYCILPPASFSASRQKTISRSNACICSSGVDPTDALSCLRS